MFNSALRIRPFNVNDLDELHAIDCICFPRDIAFSRDDLEQYLMDHKSICRLAVEEGRILGFVLAVIHRLFIAHILTLDVIPQARRCGIGTALMDSLHDEITRLRIRAAFLEVAVNNIVARRLYERLRYRYIGMIRGYYRGVDDAYCMVRLM